jgi:hypothetical protein
MKTIHAIFAATLWLAPFAAHAQSAGTTTDGTASGTAQGTDATGSDVGSTGTGTLGSDVGTAGTGTSGSDIGSAGTGTGESDVGSAGTGTGENDIGTSGTGTVGDDVGSAGTGTTGDSNTSGLVQPALSLQAASTSLRTPGTMQVTVVLAADASLSPAQARDIVVPLASSNSACTLPASTTVAWTSASGGMATVAVACAKARPGTVTISSGDASTSFTVK